MEIQLQFSADASSPFHMHSVFSRLLFDLLNLERYTEQEIEVYFSSPTIVLRSEGIRYSLHWEDEAELERWKTVASVVTRCMKTARSRSGLSIENSIMPVVDFYEIQLLVEEIRTALYAVEEDRDLINSLLEGLFAFCSYFPW